MASRAWLVLAVLALLLTGTMALALMPAVAYVAYVAFRAYTLRRYWIRCRVRDGEQLELRDVSGGFKGHVDAIATAARQ